MHGKFKYVVCRQQLSEVEQNLDFAVDASLRVRSL